MNFSNLTSSVSGVTAVRRSTSETAVTHTAGQKALTFFLFVFINLPCQTLGYFSLHVSLMHKLERCQSAQLSVNSRTICIKCDPSGLVNVR